ncbi:MAG TPA: hypothetical protein VHS03_03275 [Gaiellaceae bacterium]|jgi:YVTN family beta-propeller protein|nr:hypothetical protein [Gaiellaceae bacterium]
MFRIDPATNAVTTIQVGRQSPDSPAVSADAVWVADRLDNAVTRIDPATNQVVATVVVGLHPANPAIAPNGVVFVPLKGENKVAWIDPTTNTLGGKIAVGRGPFPAAEAFGDIWVPSSLGTQVVRIRP